MHKFSLPMRLLHWLSALLVVVLFALGLWMRSLSYYDSLYQVLPFWHKSIGFLLLFLIVLRLLTRLFTPQPAPLASHKKWEQVLARGTHWLLYGLMFGLFMSGYLVVTADNRPGTFFGWFDIPVLFNAIEQQEDIAGLVHEYCAWSLIALSVLHALAAIKHHFLDKDNTLKRML